MIRPAPSGYRALGGHEGNFLPIVVCVEFERNRSRPVSSVSGTNMRVFAYVA